MRVRTWLVISMLGGLMMLGANEGWAQAPPPPPTPPRETPALTVPAIRFDFSPPGARALGMGGAFLAIADDATASEANPAGLTILTRPEVSAHVRQASFDVATVDVNAQILADLADEFRDIFGQPSLNTDTSATFDESVTDLSFASFVKPFQRWVISLYYQQSANFEGLNRFLLLDDPTGFDLPPIAYSSQTNLDLLLESIGVSAAVKLGQYASLGLSVRSSRLDLNSNDELRVDFTDIFGLQPPIEDFFTVRETVEADDDDLTYVVGLLINPNGKVSAGLVYKEGGDYERSSVREEFDCVVCNPQTGGDRTQVQEPGEFSVPDFFGVGIAWRATDRFTIAADANRITYSDLQPEQIPGVTEEVDDETEFHLGLEYTWLTGGGTPFSLRAGYFTDPDHDGLRAIDSDDDHVTVGLGVVFKQNFQLDLAADVADRADVFLLSGVYRF